MSRLTALVRRLRGLCRRGREDAETQDELRFHLEMETEKNLRAGMDPREARRRAHVRLGGVDGIREAVRDARGGRPLEDLLRDVGYALRGARRRPGFTLAAAVSLAIPIGFNTAVFTVVDALLFGPLPVAHPAQLVDVYTSDPGVQRYSTTSYPDYLDLRAGNDVFTDMAAHSSMVAAVRVDGDVDRVMGEIVTGSYFGLLGVRPLMGRLLGPEDDRPGAERAAVISTRLWERAFGRDPGVVGRTLRIRSEPYLVVGVAPPGFAGMVPVLDADLWTPMTWVADVTTVGIRSFVDSPGGTVLEQRGTRWLFVKGRLRDGVTPARAAAGLGVIMANLAAAWPESNEDREVSLTLTEDARLPPQVAGPVRVLTAGLTLVVGVVLLVACANVMGMLLARAAARRREIGVRLAVGAGRGRLVRQLLAESLVLSFLGAGAGLALAWTLLRALAAAPSLAGGLIPLTFEFALGARAFLFTAALSVVVGVVAGLAPALRATRPNLVRDLNGAVAVARVGGGRWVLRDALVALQLAVTVPLLVLAGFFARNAVGAVGVSPGFEPDRVAAVGLGLDALGYEPDRVDRLLRDALDRVRSMPGVESASLASRVPFDIISNSENVLVSGVHGPDDRGAPVGTTNVSADYFDTLGVPLLQGRSFAAADTPDSPRVAVVSQAMALRFWPAGTAVGRRFRLDEWDGREVEVVGVSADYEVNASGEDPGAYLHLAASQQFDWPDAMLLARTAGDASALAGGIRGELRRMEPDFFFSNQGDTLRETAAVRLRPNRIAASLVIASGLVALLLGAVGLYGVVAYLVARRSREFAIRAALGARSGALLRLVLATGGWVVAFGVGSGAVLTFAATRVAASMTPDGFPPPDPAAWAGAILVITAVAAAAHIGPARRVVRLDLTRTLHAD